MKKLLGIRGTNSADTGSADRVSVGHSNSECVQAVLQRLTGWLTPRLVNSLPIANCSVIAVAEFHWSVCLKVPQEWLQRLISAACLYCHSGQVKRTKKTKSAKTNIPRLINPNTVNSMRPYQQRETMTLREMNTNCQSQTVNTNQKLTSLWTHTVTNMDSPAAPLSGAEHSTHWHCSIQPSAHTC